MRQSTYDSSIIMINKALAIRNLLLFKNYKNYLYLEKLTRRITERINYEI